MRFLATYPQDRISGSCNIIAKNFKIFFCTPPHGRVWSPCFSRAWRLPQLGPRVPLYTMIYTWTSGG